MKRVVILWICLMSSVISQAVEYGYFSRAHSSSNWSHSVALSEGDRFVAMSVDRKDDNAYTYYAEFLIDYQLGVKSRHIELFGYRGGTAGGYSWANAEDMRTINGPCTVTPKHDSAQSIIDYKIYRAGEDASKYTVALNADGTRMAIGEKSGTNGVARVFEYNGTDWEQLGSSVE